MSHGPRSTRNQSGEAYIECPYCGDFYHETEEWRDFNEHVERMHYAEVLRESVPADEWGEDDE